MNKQNILLLLLLTLILTACSLFGPQTTTYNIDLIAGDPYSLNLRQSGDEEAAVFIDAGSHHMFSFFQRDTSNNDLYYIYISNPDYTGTDYVKIQLTDANAPQPDEQVIITHEEYVEINFNITSEAE